jgi:hypothetical protein
VSLHTQLPRMCDIVMAEFSLVYSDAKNVIGVKDWETCLV